MLTKLQEFFASKPYPVFLVGGYLRDSLLLSPSKRDIDLAVGSDSQSVGRELASALGGTFVALSPAFDKARVVVPESGADTWTVDLSGFSGTIEEDLARRDFTINAMALPLSRWEDGAPGELLIDPYNGRRDMSDKAIRAVSPQVFRDDPGRLLRCVRLAVSLGFRMDPETARSAMADASHINEVAGERLRDEFLAILAQDGAKGSLEALDRLDLLCRIIPELAATKGVDQPRMHYWDVWGHSLHAVENAERITKGHQNSPVYTLVYWTAETHAYFSQEVCDGQSRRTLLKLAALFHDIAKPQTKQLDKTGRTRFPGHSEQGAAVTENRLGQLRIGAKGISMVSKMIQHHLRPGHTMQGVELPTKRAIYRYYRDLGDVAVDTLYLSQADYLAAKGPELNPVDWASHARMISHIVHAAFNPESSIRPHRLISGNELMEHFNLQPGPVIGRMLDTIEEARAAGDISSRDGALALAAGELGNKRGGN